MEIAPILAVEDINVLRGQRSCVRGFVYKYGNEREGEDETLHLLRKNFTRTNSLYLMAQERDMFAGFCAIDTDWREDGYAFLREIFIHPDFQRRGIAEECIRRCMLHTQNLGLKGIVTETAFENTPMQHLCAKLGFKPWNNPEWNDGVTLKLLFE